MVTQQKEYTYRIIFTQEDKVYEIFAKSISEESLMGFIEIEELVFGNNGSLVLDPSEEKLKKEFQGVRRTHIPMHMILRIDEMEKEQSEILKESVQNNVRQLPVPFKHSRKDFKDQE